MKGPESAYKTVILHGSGEWDDHQAWKKMALWEIPGVPGETIEAMNIVLINNTYPVILGRDNLSLVDLLISGNGKLTVTNLSELQNEYHSGKSLEVSHYLSLDGSIRLIEEFQLLHRKEGILRMPVMKDFLNEINFSRFFTIGFDLTLFLKRFDKIRGLPFDGAVKYFHL